MLIVFGSVILLLYYNWQMWLYLFHLIGIVLELNNVIIKMLAEKRL